MLFSATQGPLPLPRLLGVLQLILLSWVPLWALSSIEEDTWPKVIPPSQSQPICHLCLMTQAVKARQTPPSFEMSLKGHSSSSSPWRFQRGLCYDCEVKVTQSCLTLCNPMDYIVHEILQARILEWVAFPFSRGSSQHRDQTQVSHIAGGFFTSWATKEVLLWLYCITIAYLLSVPGPASFTSQGCWSWEPSPTIFPQENLHIQGHFQGKDCKCLVPPVHKEPWRVSATSLRTKDNLDPSRSLCGIHSCVCVCCCWGSQVLLVVKNLPANAGAVTDVGSIPGSGRSPGGGHGNPLQYSCLENPNGQRSLVGDSP